MGRTGDGEVLIGDKTITGNDFDYSEDPEGKGVPVPISYPTRQSTQHPGRHRHRAPDYATRHVLWPTLR